ncbi:plant UBX domain-containing protein 1-like isoform X1 [Phoenix dactylifera]|uniref:Plant UBX domain-containing protein 1-like isoform X1 n=1 Tax=Phoenix dactylifera TaxID=42345 RepID=A0A8B8ZWI6_PHODC|nr:plant UBX domain-containing protein 1-like isoform X1 [Phoenix dactylifera]
MEAEQAKAKLLAVAEELGHEIRIFTNSANSAASKEISASSSEEPDHFYDLTPEDYYRIMSDRIRAQSQILKTRKMREAEAAARRARITKAVIRVRFPDNYILEAKFQPSEKIESLMHLLMKVVARPDLPFYLYTTPPKERIKDTSKDFYSAGFAPGAIVYFSFDLPKDKESDSAVAKTGPYLRDDILSLNGLDFTSEKADPVTSEPEPPAVGTSPAVPDPKPPEKKPAKPKWLKL